MPFARLHSQMVCTQSEPAEIPQHMFVQILVQVAVQANILRFLCIQDTLTAKVNMCTMCM